MESAQANKAVLDYVVIEFKDNDIMRFEFTKDLVVTMDLTMEMIDVCKKLCPDRLYRSLKIINHKFKIENEVVTLFASDIRKGMMSVEAVVLTTPALRIFANFYLRVKKPVIKTKFFDTEQDAVAWLLQH
jgi:hypothetical protein